MDRVDALVIGGGVVGLAAARALAESGRETVLAEAAGAIGQGVSSRSSEVIHAGLYYEPGTLKARLCVRGRELLYAFAAAHGVPHRRCGKLVVATAPGQHAALERTARCAAAAGVPLEPWSAARVREVEPELACSAALWSAETGIVDSHALIQALAGAFERAGGAIALGSRVEGAHFAPGRPGVVQVWTAAGTTELEAASVVNAAGLGACALARCFEGLPGTHVPREHFAKGSYFSLATRHPFKRLVYPVPVDAWLGVHLTLDLGGQARFGPDLEWLEHASPAAIDYRVDPSRAAVFEASIRRFWPGLPDGALVPAYSGVRPKIHGPDAPAPDFRIDGPAVHGVPGLVNLFGIESPGLTSSLAIAEEVLRAL